MSDSSTGRWEKLRREITNDSDATQIRYVIKRNGSLETFDREKIASAIRKAYEAVYGELDPEPMRIELVTAKVEEKLEALMAARHAKSAPAIEEIQDMVENALIEAQEAKVAKA